MTKKQFYVFMGILGVILFFALIDVMSRIY